MLSAEAKADLIARCKYAHAHGFSIASAEEYARELGYAGEPPPHKVKKLSPAHLLHLAEADAGAVPAKKKGLSPFTAHVPPGVYTETRTDTPKAKAAKKAPTPPPPPPEPQPPPPPTKGEDITDDDLELLIPT